MFPPLRGESPVFFLCSSLLLGLAAVVGTALSLPALRIRAAALAAAGCCRAAHDLVAGGGAADRGA